MYAKSEVADTILKKGCKDANKTKYVCGPGEFYTKLNHKNCNKCFFFVVS